MDEKYISEVVDGIKELTSNQYEVTYNLTRKNNGMELNGICIHNRASNISPVIYVDDYYMSGMTPFETAVEVVERFQRIKDQEIPFDVSEILNFDAMKDKIAYRVINKDANAELLEEVPWIEVAEDLAVVCYLDLGNGATVTIQNRIMDAWGLTEEMLFDIADVNTPNMKPMEMRSLAELTVEMMEQDGMLFAIKYEMGCEDMPDEEFKQMLIESRDDGNSIPAWVIRGGDVYGASVLMYEKAMNTVREQLGRDFFVLPSSIHELIVVPYDERYNVTELKEMVAFVNEEKLRPDEYLSDSIYFYNEKGLSVVVDNPVPSYEDRYYSEAR